MKKTNKTEQLFMQHARQMYNTALRITGNKQDAEDALQEAYIKALTNIQNLKSKVHFGGWLKKIVVHEAINFHRSKIHYVDIETVNTLPDEYEDKNWFPEVSMKQINSEIQHLPDGARLIFSLFLLENYSHKDIAILLGISESTSKSQYHRAKKILKVKLAKKISNG